MSIESDSDRLDIIRTLAGIERDDVTVRHPAGAFDAIFDNGFFGADVGDLEIESALPVLVARTRDVAGITKGTPLTFKDVDGQDVTYRLERHEPDGTGMSRILLSL